MIKPSNPPTTSQQVEGKLARVFYAESHYNPLFLGVAGFGFATMYLLTQFGIFGSPTPQLLYIAGAIFLTAILQIPAVNLARQDRGIAANFLGALSVFVLAFLLTTFWSGIVFVVILIALITPITAIRNGLPRNYYPPMGLMVIAGIAGIIYVNAHPFISNRLQSSSTTAIAALAFLGAATVLLITVTIIARSRTYRNLRTQLLTSFIIILSIPIILAIVLSVVGAYVNNETQFFNTLETISRLKQEQISYVINNLSVDATWISQDPFFSRNTLSLLNPGQASEVVLSTRRTALHTQLQDFQKAGGRTYSEIMVLDFGGKVVVSTDPSREGTNFKSQPFYQSGILSSFTELSQDPSFNDGKLIYATPIYDTDGQVIRGVLVLRANDGSIKNIMESTPSIPEVETYLLDANLQPLTRTRTATQVVDTQASQALSNAGPVEGRGTYKNYAGENVLGYYQRIQSLNVMFIAEVPSSYVLRTSLNSLLGSSILALFAFLIAIVAVAVSAESISEPIGALANIAEGFAAGKLTLRASIDRHDEIGALGRAYDQMAEQLQDTINKLEQRVADRTEALEDQTLRLRISAEVARDAAASRNLNELLIKASTLIQDRFELYHTGIFLLDNNKEYVILAASPTEAGKRMIANRYRIRVDEDTLVGQVASTEEPRISHDTGIKATLIDNPYLPNTHSEMALPLKVENRMIGVLDVHSDHSQAFNDDDIAIMQILADQLATAIERTRLLQQVEQNLRDIERAYGQFTRESWKTLSEGGVLGNVGYHFNNIRIQPISELPELGAEVMEKGTMVASHRENGTRLNRVVFPIKLRGETIGVVSVNLNEGYTQSTVSTLQLAIERLASSLESARLNEEARTRADREQAIAQVTSSISSTAEFDAILRTTVEEVGRILGDAEVSIQIVDDTES